MSQPAPPHRQESRRKKGRSRQAVVMGVRTGELGHSHHECKVEKQLEPCSLSAMLVRGNVSSCCVVVHDVGHFNPPAGGVQAVGERG
jgi:hypothetical protein